MIQITPGNSTEIALALFAVADLIAVLGFIVLADLTQLFVQVSRSVTMTLWRYRKAVMIIGVMFFAGGMFISLTYSALSGTVLVIHGIIFILLFTGGYINVPYFMFRTQQGTAKYIPVGEAVKYLDKDCRLMVVEVNGDACAFAHDWLARPHVAGDIIGGKEVCLAYCSLSHLGTAYSPYIGDRKLDLKVMLQLENNLVMFDEASNMPIQQIYGALEGGNERLKKYPTQVMSLKAFSDIYPQGRVFYNPPSGWWDRMVRRMVLDVTRQQYTSDKPAFPTIKHLDNRLPPKEQVYGIALNGQARAYSKDFLKRNPVVTTSLGGEDVVMVYYPEFDTVAGFSGKGEDQKVTEIDIHGNSPAGKLNRIPVDSEVLWMIWCNFYPDTGLNNQGAG